MNLFDISALSVFALALSCCATSQAGPVSPAKRSLPGYSPVEQVSGVIRIWGHGGKEINFIEPLVASWEKAFRGYHPGIRFENHLVGDDSAIGGLYTGAADLALITREIWPTEVDGYEQVFGHKPSRVVIATGSLDAPHYAPALAIFVQKDNPVSKLTLAEVQAIFGGDRPHGLRPIGTWGDVGLTAEWSDKPIHPYGYGLRSELAYFFTQTALGGGEKWSCQLREVVDGEAAERGGDDGQLILDALAKDPYGIAVSSLAHTRPGVKALSLAGPDGGKYYPATLDTVSKRQYPLARTAAIYFDRSPGKPLEPKIKEFLNYVTSEAGQTALSHESQYLPLTPELAEEARRALE